MAHYMLDGESKLIFARLVDQFKPASPHVTMGSVMEQFRADLASWLVSLGAGKLSHEFFNLVNSIGSAKSKQVRPYKHLLTDFYLEIPSLDTHLTWLPSRFYEIMLLLLTMDVSILPQLCNFVLSSGGGRYHQT
jgi:hypothetical protein